jgi:hypothetical protein
MDWGHGSIGTVLALASARSDVQAPIRKRKKTSVYLAFSYYPPRKLG